MGLSAAPQNGLPVHCIFIFDTYILSRLQERADRRVDYLHQAVLALHHRLKQHGSGLQTFHSTPEAAFASLSKSYEIGSVSANRDYEPEAIRRDGQLKKWLHERDIAFLRFHAQPGAHDHSKFSDQAPAC